MNKATVITKLNLNRFQAYTLNLNFPFTLNSWWSGNADLNGLYEKTNAEGLSGYLNRGRVTFQGKLMQDVKIGKSYTAEVVMNYSGLEANGYDLIQPMFATDAGVNYRFLSKIANIKFSVSNIFNGSAYHLISSAQGSNIDTRLNPVPRIARLTFSYTIGRKKVSAHKWQKGAADEERRVNSGY